MSKPTVITGAAGFIGFMTAERLHGLIEFRLRHEKVHPFKESDVVDRPVSLYAASKKANELMADSYSHVYAMPTTGLRFFTV